MSLPLVSTPSRSLAAGVSRPASASELRKAAGNSEEAGLDAGDLFKCGIYGGLAHVGGAAGPSIAAHEYGHAIAANLVHQGANPSVSVSPFKGGVTRYTPGPLTELGQKLGADGSRALVAGAGTLVDATSSAIAFAVGYRIRKEHPILGPAMMGYAGLTMANSILYAGSALTGSLPVLAKQGNDFAALAVSMGLHPVASIAILGAILPAEYLLLRQLEKHGI